MIVGVNGRKKFLSGNLVFFILSFIFLSISIIGMLLGQYCASQKEQLTFSEIYIKQKMHHYVKNIDKVIRNDFYEFADQNIFKYDNQNQLSTFFTSENASMDFLGKMNVQLYELRKTNPSLYEIVMYRTYDGAIISDRRGKFLNYQNRNPEYRGANDLFNIFDFFLFDGNQPFSKSIETNDNKIAFLFPYLENTETQNLLGYVILFTYKERIFGRDQVVETDNGSFLVIDQNKQVLFNQGNNLFSSDVITEIVAANPLGDKNFLYQTINQVEYGFTYENAQEEDWSFVYYEPAETMRKIVSLGMAGTVTLSLFFLCIFSIGGMSLLYGTVLKKSWKDMKELSERDEESSRQDSFRISGSKYKYFMDLIYGSVCKKDCEEVVRYLIDEEELKPYYVLVSISPNRSQIREKYEGDRDVFIDRLQNEIKEYFVQRYVKSISIVHHANEIFCLINQGDDHINKVFYLNLLKQLEDVHSMGFNIFISSPATSHGKLPELYGEIKKAYRYTYIYNDSNVLTSIDIKHFDNNSPGLSQDFITEMYSLINLENYEGLKKSIQEKVEEIRNRALSYDYTQNFILQIMNCISNAYTDKQIKTSSDKMSSLMYDFRKIESLDQCIEWIMKCIDKYREYMSDRVLSIDKTYTERIIAYITENMDHISLNDAAEKFGISTSHLSRVFKSQMSMNFTEYVTQRRLEKAVLLLQSEPNYSIGEIAKMLGYETPYYFSKKFKEKYQLTPAMYRKQYFSTKTE